MQSIDPTVMSRVPDLSNPAAIIAKIKATDFRDVLSAEALSDYFADLTALGGFHVPLLY